MKSETKEYLTKLLHDKKITEAITWYNTNICKNYSRARRKILSLDKKLSDETHYHIDFFKNGYTFHFYVEYYIYGNLVLTRSLIEI